MASSEAKREYVQKKIASYTKRATEALEEACSDGSLERDDYRKVLEEVQEHVEVSLEALDDDDRRDGKSKRSSGNWRG